MVMRPAMHPQWKDGLRVVSGYTGVEMLHCHVALDVMDEVSAFAQAHAEQKAKGVRHG